MSLRLDRLATLYLVNPVQRVTSGNTGSIPILMYHSITDLDESGVHAYYRTATSPATFAAQMRELHDRGYSVLGLADAAKRLQDGGLANGKTVVITFDDGYRDFLLNAAPALAQYGFTATMYLPTAYIGDSTQVFNNKPCLTWSEIRQLQAGGISFGSHTVNHPQLHQLSANEVNEEIVKSKQTMEQKLGCAVASFAYPYAFPEADAAFKGRLRDMLMHAGYENGVCTTLGRAAMGSDLFFLKRLPVNSCDDPQLFRAKLNGAYDWLATPQYLVKAAKSWARAGR
jgi:peptidoglycan/xylan/chitin deacetylase (PgdA/CDA1 family)